MYYNNGIQEQRQPMVGNHRYKLNEPQSHWRKRLIQILHHSSEDQPASEINVGRRLQELRIMRGLSQRALAEMSGLNFNTLSLLENEKTSPNVSTLQQLACALNVPITAFFESISENRVIVHQKSGERQHTSFPQGRFEDLGGGMALGEATPLLMILTQIRKAIQTHSAIVGRNLFIAWRAAWFSGWVMNNTC